MSTDAETAKMTVDAEKTGEKRPAEAEAEAASAGESPNAKKQKVETSGAGLKATPPDSAVVKKQIEYYFSDMNLKTDKFFHEKINADPEGWLPVPLLLSCNKVKLMKATQADLFGALKDSELETKEDPDGSAFVRRKGNAKLPALEARAAAGAFANKKKMSNAFDGGMLFQVKGIPEEQTWLNLKEALKGKLPEGIGAQVWFVSSVSEQQSCVVALSPFEKDFEFVSNDLKVSLGGADLKIEVCHGDALQQAMKMLPKGHKERRDKAAKTRQKARQRPIQVGGQKFANINTLRGKVKEILASRTDKEELKVGGPDYTLVRAMMDWHPSKDRKTKGMRGIKVDQSEHGGSRCFWVLKQEGEGANEDFSMKKCIEALEANPPYADVHQPAAGSGSSASAAAPASSVSPAKAEGSPKKEDQVKEEEPAKTTSEAAEVAKKPEEKKE